METRVLTIVDFVLARIAEDETDARRAGFWGKSDLSEWEHAVVHQAGRIQTVSMHGNKGYEDHVAITHDYEGLSDSVSEEAGPHIARFDPARILAECEAKRHVATLMGYVLESWDANHGREGRSLWPDVNRRERSHARTVLEQMASVYSDHPDFRDEWLTNDSDDDTGSA